MARAWGDVSRRVGGTFYGSAFTISRLLGYSNPRLVHLLLATAHGNILLRLGLVLKGELRPDLGREGESCTSTRTTPTRSL